MAEVDLDDLRPQGGSPERRAKAKVVARTGRYRSAALLEPGEPARDLALDATLRRAALRRVRAGMPGVGAGEISAADFCKKIRLRPCEHLIVFAVDSSDSMGQGAEVRMRAAKGAVLALLRKAYQDRHQVALVAFGGEEARVALPATIGISRAQQCLASLPTGGATPFADGLLKAWQLIRLARRKNPGIKPLLVVISDGEANVPLTPGAPPMRELLELGHALRQDHIVSVVIDAATEPGKGVELALLARQMGAALVKVAELRAPHILKAVREAEAGAGAAR